MILLMVSNWTTFFVVVSNTLTMVEFVFRIPYFFRMKQFLVNSWIIIPEKKARIQIFKINMVTFQPLQMDLKCYKCLNISNL